jgi:signal transduction histidine kinase
MIGNNVQSHFYEDCEHNMWFSTYNALHHYNREKDNFKAYQFRDDASKIVDHSYKVLAFTEPFLYIRYGDYLGIFDIHFHRLVESWHLDLAQYHYFDTYISDTSIIISAGHLSKCIAISMNNDIHAKPKLKELQIEKLADLLDVQIIDHQTIHLHNKISATIFKYDLIKDKIDELYSHNQPIIYSKMDDKNQYLYISDKDRLTEINLRTKTEQQSWPYPQDWTGNPSPINLLNNTIYQGIDGKGVIVYDIAKRKMKHFPLTDKGLPSNARSITKSKDGTFWHSSRDHGIGHFDHKGINLGKYNKENGLSPSNFIMQVLELTNGDIIGLGASQVIKYNKYKDKFESVKQADSNLAPFIGQVCESQSNQFLVINYSDFHSLYRLELVKEDKYTLKPIFLEGIDAKDEFVQVFAFANDHYILGINSSDIALMDYKNEKGKIIKRFKLNSSLNDILPVKDSIYISTDGGLFIIDKNFTNPPRKIIDDEGKLNQNIYCTLIHKDKFFLSTNDGLYMYSPASNIVHRFTKADGIQDLEYNSLAGIKDDDGTMIFGGVNGVNIFHPDSIRFLQEPSKIHISKLLINDEPHPSYIHANGIENLNLPYSENTLSFFFNGIDYADMEAIKLKYQLVNYDKHPVALDKNDGLARYANLPPGDYEFNIFATNSDGIWNKEPRIVNITIEPPFWRTWWFRLLVTAAALGSGFSLVRSRYKRRLEKQNQLLREQALMIEKQQGIEAERARIAAEMHDDLGSGLTTIRFLSEKALKSVNSESEINEIRKIADQSNALVSNMSEIIWALNSRLDNSEELSAYLRRYVGEYLSEHHMEHHFESEGELSTNILTGEKRRNILLVIKEILHNIVKYSGANGVELHIVFQGEKVNMEITELGGVGFDFDSKIGTGNGLYNIQKRIEKLNGSIKYDRTETGMKISIKIPVENE